MLAFLAGVALLPGCDFPADPEGTLDRVEGGTMRVGVVDAPPWASTGGPRPRGVEVELVEELAARLDAEIEWYEGTETELTEALAGFQLDLVIGGLTRSSPWAKEVALSRPFIDTEIQVGLPPSSPMGDEIDADDLSGMRIWVERGSPAAALLRQEEDDAEPVFFDRLAEVRGPALLPSYEIRAIGYQPTDYILRDDEHAIAAPPGENAMLVELDRFLLNSEQRAEELLDREARR